MAISSMNLVSADESDSNSQEWFVGLDTFISSSGPAFRTHNSTACDAENKSIRRTSRDTATPISRPVFMLSSSSNLNPVIDTRPR